MSFVDSYMAKGWLPMRGIFRPELIDALREEYRRQKDLLTEEDGPLVGFRQVGGKRLMLSIQLTGPFLEEGLYGNPLLLGVLALLLGKEMVIDNFTCVTALPGAEEQELHFDHVDLFPEHKEMRAAVPPYAITVAVPLVDLTPETGTTRLFPGSHRSARGEDSDLPYLSRGDCFLMDYRLWHHGTANRSDHDRPVLYIIFARPWFTDARNFNRQPRLRMDQADVAKVPKKHSRLFRRLAAKGALDLTENEMREL